MSKRCYEGRLVLLLTGLVSLWFWSVTWSVAPQTLADGGDAKATAGSPPATDAEAHDRARLLHETIRGSLQVMHRDYFDDENPPAIPSSSLEDVFSELERRHQVHVKWLTVETDVLNVDHEPQNDFEKQAVTALKQGQVEFTATDADTFRFAGPILLASQCLKCHVKNRTSTRPRKAGLVITMPLRSAADVGGEP